MPLNAIENGPNRTFTPWSPCCGAAGRTCHSLRAQNQGLPEIAKCGTTLPLVAQQSMSGSASNNPHGLDRGVALRL